MKFQAPLCGEAGERVAGAASPGESSPAFNAGVCIATYIMSTVPWQLQTVQACNTLLTIALFLAITWNRWFIHLSF
jgi:hypothetical protein